MVDSTRGRRGMLARVAANLLLFQLFIRFPAFGFTAILPFLGAASARLDLPIGRLAGLLAAALAFHSFSYVENDVIDLPLDRRQPLRQADPLVRGLISPAAALAFALAQVPLALAITFWLGAPAPAYAALAAGFVLMSVYNLWGKRVALPLATDLAQGLAWAALVLYGALVSGAGPAQLTWLLAAFVVLYVMLINSIHGSLRDLANDFASGKRSTAILLGARPIGAANLGIPARLRAYAFALQLALVGLLAWPLLRNDLGYGTLAWAATLLAVGLLAARCLRLLAQMLPDGVAQAAMIEPAKSHVFLSLAMLVALFVAALPPAALALLLAACIAPLLPTQWWARQMRQAAALLGLPGRGQPRPAGASDAGAGAEGAGARRQLAAIWEAFLALQRFIRLPAFGFSALLTLLGAATTNPAPPAWWLWRLLAATLAFHQFGYVLNDVVDLPVDRLNPGRAGYPLVRGWPRPRQALAYALAQVPLAFAITAWLGAGAGAYGALAAAFLGVGAYDLWGKRARFPPLTDAVQGLGWAALAVYGAAAAGAPNRLTWLLAAWVLIYIVLVNGVHASLRDLESDAAGGAATTAILLGARPGAAPRGLIAYAAALQLALAALTLWPLIGGGLGYRGWAWAGALGGVALTQLVCAWCTAQLFRPRRRLGTVVPVMAFIICSLAGLIGLFGPRLAPQLLAFVLVSFLAPLVIYDSLFRVLGWLRAWAAR